MRASAGSITRVGENTWRIRVSCGYDPNTGKRKQKSKQIRGSRRDAERIKAEMMMSDEELNANKAENMSVADLTHKYLESKREQVRIATYDEYERIALKLINSKLGDISAEELHLHEKEVREWLRSFRGGRVRLAQYKILRQIMNYGKKQHYITVNVCDFINPPEVKKRDIEVIPMEEVDNYLDAVRDTPIEAGVLIMLYMGLRRSEALARKWSDCEWFDEAIDGSVATLKINSSIRELKGGGVVFDKPKTKKSNRVAYVPEICGKRLKALQCGEWVCELNGEVMRPDFFSKYWRKCLKKSSLKHIQVKNLRHSCGTMLIRELGASVADVSELLGHSTTRTTEEYYLQQSDTSKRRVASLWNKV